MKSTRSIRIAAGTVCLVTIALVMGWFVGHYVPGEPGKPEPRIGDGLYTKTGHKANKIADFAPGSTLELRDITQGALYHTRPDEATSTPPEIVALHKESEMWEYESPNIDLSVTEVKVISTTSFAEWYPDYTNSMYTYDPMYEDSELIAVGVSITNVSHNPITQWYKLPIENVTLWSENLSYIDDSLGAGAVLDGAFGLANTNLSGEILRIEPGESQSLILPFKINKNALKNQEAFDDLDPSDFCLQFVDFDSGTAYRLWL